MSLLAILTMIVLFVCETWAFSHTKINSSIAVDPNEEQLLRLNFNVTLYDVQCDFVSVGEFYYYYCCCVLILEIVCVGNDNIFFHSPWTNYDC